MGKNFTYALIVFLMVAVAIFATVVVSAFNQVGGSGAFVEEDDPRWDCETMGNKLCGPQLPTFSFEVNIS